MPAPCGPRRALLPRRPATPRRTACALCAAFGAACQADEAPLQQVEIVGIRASADAAAMLKKQRDEVSDAIVADDIDKLPDASVAEALQRVPGVQIARDRGEGATVVVRGLGQVETTVDGREVFSAGTGRTLDFASMASALVAGVDVYKTPSAERIEGGMAGQVDLRTRRPFDFRHGALEVTARALRAPLAAGSAIQFSGVASTRLPLAGGELGLLAAIAVEPRPWREDQK
ncbi:MAG TPA: TonB-dependent receptor plug domain-containing protein, partial [Burkholderiaceae bacterium]